jgi:hypothetical protein
MVVGKHPTASAIGLSDMACILFTISTVSVTRTHLFAGVRMCWVERVNEKQTTPARKRRPTADLLLDRIRGCDSLQRLTRHRRSVRPTRRECL